MVHTRHSYVKDIEDDSKDIGGNGEINEEHDKRIETACHAHEINDENEENNDEDKKVDEIKAEEKNTKSNEEKVMILK